MTQSMTKAGRQLAARTVFGQLIISALLAIGLALSLGWDVATSSLMGALAAIIPNALFGVIAFVYAGARANQKVVKSFFVGEGVKLLLTAALISLLFLTTSFYPVWLLCGFVIAVLAQWVAPILFLKST